MLFFERLKTQNDEWPNTFSRNSFPDHVKTQCWIILEDVLFLDRAEMIVTILREAIGVYHLAKPSGMQIGNLTPLRELNQFFHQGIIGKSDDENLKYTFSALELMCRCAEQNKIDEVNSRLRLAGIGYKYVEKYLIPIDDDILNETSNVPAISLLNRPLFADSYAYLNQAYIDYRSGTRESFQNAIDNSVKAIEALLKIILRKKNIAFTEKDTYMPLLQKAQENGLYPNISVDKLVPLTNALKAIGEIRNKGGGHGDENKKVADRLVRLALNHATANMLFIAETFLEDVDQNPGLIFVILGDQGTCSPVWANIPLYVGQFEYAPGSYYFLQPRYLDQLSEFLFGEPVPEAEQLLVSDIFPLRGSYNKKAPMTGP